MATATLQATTPALFSASNGTISEEKSYKRRDLKTIINHADEVAHQKELEATGGKEDLSKGGDVYYPSPPKMAVNVTVEDITGRENEFSFEKNGFVLAKQKTKVMLDTEDLCDEGKIKNEYYPEMEKWLKELTGATRVLVFHHGTRISTSKFRVNNIKKEDISNRRKTPGPAVFAAHLDQSSWQAGNVLHKHLPDETETLLHGRFMIVNAWRPIKTVYKDPFGIADASTVPCQDLVVRPNRWFTEIRESMGLKASPAHRWYYKFAQQADEVLVFKQFDNHGRARACPHSAFADQEYEDSNPRESIEVRALLLWPNHEAVLQEN